MLGLLVAVYGVNVIAANFKGCDRLCSMRLIRESRKFRACWRLPDFLAVLGDADNIQRDRANAGFKKTSFRVSEAANTSFQKVSDLETPPSFCVPKFPEFRYSKLRQLLHSSTYLPETFFRLFAGA
jgi:hypothetical protein